jgi:hypothetical protein
VQKETARYLAEDKKAGYLFTAVKDNQPSLFAALDALDWQNTPVAHVMRDRDTAGTRRAPSRCCLLPGTWDSPTPRKRSSSSAPSATLMTGSCARPSPRSASPAAAAHAAAPRRSSPRPPAVTGISKLCIIRDTTLDEDAQRLRAGTSAQVMAAVRNTAIAALRLAGFTSTAPGRRWAARNPARPIAVLCLE